MKKRFTFKRTALGLLIVLVICQLFRIDKTNPPLDPSKDLINITQPPAQVASILRVACYDCHSNEVSYPWYTNIAPVSWWIRHHINEGRHHLNFSTWGNYTARKADHKLEECAELVEEGEMPMTSYTLMHGTARLTTAQQALLVSWFNGLRTHDSDQPKEK